MDLEKISKINPRLVRFAMKVLKSTPVIKEKVQGLIDKEYDSMMGELEVSLRPYRDKVEAFPKIPEKGLRKNDILKIIESMKKQEESKWKDGFVSGAVYHGDRSHIDFLNTVYSLNSQLNPLHSDIWPSGSKYEAEIVSMTANMLGREHADRGKKPEKGVCGVVSSGGTESILLAMKTYRDIAKKERGIKKPEMITPVSAHVAFDKAAQYFEIKQVKIPVDRDYKADVSALEKAITKNTAVIVGSAPSFPHGIIDPIAEMSEIARERGIGFHTDSCLGGFLLPWARKLGHTVPDFDFRLPGVTSVSADTHKYGYASKGTSVILYRSPEIRRYQYFKSTEWPGGLYYSPTFAGSRPGALSAACWASMLSIGESGYLESVKNILEAAKQIKEGIREIPGLHVLGDPLWVIAFGAPDLDIYKVMEYMSKKGWSLNGLHRPPCVHLCVTLRHTQKGVPKRFLKDLKAAVEYVKRNPSEKGDMAPVYGLAATFPDRAVVEDMLEMYIDMIYKV